MCIILDFNSHISKLKLLTRVMASFTYSEGCCSLFRMVRSVISSHKVSGVNLPLKRYLIVSYKSQKTATEKCTVSQEVAAILNYDLFAISGQSLFVCMRSQLHVQSKIKVSIDIRSLVCTIIFCHAILTLLLQLLTDCGYLSLCCQNLICQSRFISIDYLICSLSIII